MTFKLVVADPKSRKSYQKEISGEGLAGKKIGEKVAGSVAGIEGFELEITGGSDKDGFPMRKDIEGTARKKVLLSGGTGFKAGARGVRKRKSVRGNTVSSDIVQVNTKVVKYGPKPLEQLLGKTEQKEKKEEKAGGGKKEEAEEKETPAPAEEGGGEKTSTPQEQEEQKPAGENK